MSPETFESYLSRLFDNDLSPQEFSQLETHLSHSPEARFRYMEWVDFQNIMELVLSAPTHQKIGASNVIPIDHIVRIQRSKSLRIASFTAAALIIIGAMVMTLLVTPEKHQGLAFEISPGSLFEITHTQSELVGSDNFTMDNGSRLQLTQGTVKLIFNSGVKSIIMAPADITLNDYNQLQLEEGTAWFQVPKGAEGFQVTSNDLKVVDLGTEFGVISNPDGNDEVHVFKGEVEVSAIGIEDQITSLTKGQACQLSSTETIEEVALNTKAFLVSLPKSLPYLHWSFNEVEEGGFTAGGNHPDTDLGLATPKNRNASAMQIPGRFGKAVKFSGKAGEELLTQWPGISGDSPRTIACWIRVTPQSLSSFGSTIAVWGTPAKKTSITQNSKWKFAISPDGNATVVGYNGALAGSQNIADNQWHHIACTHKMSSDGTSVVSIFVDGKRVNSIWEPITGSYPASTMTPPDTVTTTPESFPLRFGKSLLPSNPINGCLDEVYIFKGALNAKDIKRLATSNQPQP